MIGSSCIDEYYEMEHAAKLGEKTITRYLGSKVGGMIGNAAAVAASYNMTVYMMDIVNHSYNTEMILEDCRKSGILLDMIRYDDALPDVKCLIFLKDGERVIYVVPSQKRNVVLDKEQKDILSDADYVYTSVEEIKRFKEPDKFMSWLRKVKTKIAIDVEYINEFGKEDEWRIIKNSDVIFINDEGHEQLTRKIADNYQEELMESGRIVVHTKGDKGCEISVAGSDKYKIASYKVTPVDTTGAGDTFNASFVYGLSQGWDIGYIGRFSNAAAGRAILNMGARSGAVGELAVKEFMKEREKI